MNEAAYEAIEQAWRLTVKARALCPYADETAVGMSDYISPSWYQNRGATYVVNLAAPLTKKDTVELRQIGGFINRSFIIWMAAILEDYNVVPCGESPDTSLEGGCHVQLVKKLRNRFAHGEWKYNSSNAEHRKTRTLLQKLLPNAASKGSGFVTSIADVLEPLKDGVLTYIRAAT